MQDEVKVSQADRGVFGEVLACLSTANELRAAKDCNQAQQAIFWEQKALSVLARHRHQAERETLARMEWRDIESAPKDKYFLAVIDAGETERRLLHALGLADDLADYREIHIAYRRKGDPKRKIRTSPHGRIYTATHWMNLPELPEN